MSEPTYVAVRCGEERPLWSTERDSREEAIGAAISSGLERHEFEVVNTEDLETE